MRAPRTIRAAILIAGATMLLLASGPAPARASGGGGCGRPITEAAGTRVVIRQFCFLPTALHVAVGQTVVFRNLDAFEHTVSGANAAWGSYRPLRGLTQPGTSSSTVTTATYRFTRPGVYPYVCLIHPGMTGAIVVGRPNAATAAATPQKQAGVYPVAARPDVVYVASGAIAAVPRPAPVPVGTGWRVAAIVTIALLLALGAGVASAVRLRERSRTPARA